MAQMTAALRHDLPFLQAQRAIGDVILGVCRAMDDQRWDGLDALFHPEATVRYSIRADRQNYRDWAAAARTTMRALGGTRHQIGNVMIDVADDHAWSESYVTATHKVPVTAPREGYWDGRDEPYLGIAGGRYIDRFERRNGIWKLAVRQTLIEWRTDMPLSH